MPSLPTRSLVLTWVSFLRFTWQNYGLISMDSTSSSIKCTLFDNSGDFNACVSEVTSSSFYMMFALFSDQLTNESDYFEVTCTLDIIPFCLMVGNIFKFSNNFKLGPFIEYTLWLAMEGSWRWLEGILRSRTVIELIKGERARQFAKVRPTGPHPATITYETLWGSIWS